MRKLFPEGLSIEDRVNKLETILSRNLRKVHKTTTAIIPPHLISHCETGDAINGDIFKVMMFKGTITKGLICLDKRYKKPIRIDVTILNESIGTTKTFYLSKMRESVVLNEETVDGSMIKVSAKPTDEEEKLKEVWISVLWTPEVKDSKVKQCLIDSLENAASDSLLEE